MDKQCHFLWEFRYLIINESIVRNTKHDDVYFGKGALRAMQNTFFLGVDLPEIQVVDDSCLCRII